ncbi:hypothetical protein [Paucihalobacter sp.]|uniref:hypothetical protein n=1 Tax=Paucihalobacter sp. TaxID=2850405 RepID=UPI003D161C65
MSKKIAIIGCGWFGLPLAKLLIEKGYLVNGTTTSRDKIEMLSNSKINPFVLELSENSISKSITEVLNNVDVAVINIPPGLRRQPNKNYAGQMAQFVPYLENSGVKHVLYISSTSVFEDDETFPIILDNTSPNGKNYSAQQLIKTELQFQNSSYFTTTILRFSGLIGNDRHPAHSLSGRKNISNPMAPINLIHLKDCINISKLIIKNDVWNETFNAASNFHPSKIDYYTQACENFRIPRPEFNIQEKNVGKIINSEKLVQKLNYKIDKPI